jgi:ABC-2 type transport system ATP-binding protein
MTTELPIEKQKTQTKGDSANTKATSEGEVILEVRNLQKTYTAGLRSFHIERIFEKQKTVNAVKGISFDVFRGEIFGFLGPNGAGKTTTIKMLTGLIRRTGGTAKLLGLPIPSAEAMGRVGFLPENPYIYPYLTPREFVTLCGQLNGLSGAHLEKRVKECLERVGVAYAMDRDAKALSKGMLQRTALAAAIVHDPELLLLDEPMSGLDPVGRKEVRDIIAQEKEAGRTVFFSSHILSDVEMLCDRVCILRKGEVVVAGKISDLLASESRRTEITLSGNAELILARFSAHTPKELGSFWALDVLGDHQAVIREALDQGLIIESILPKRETLEDLFVRKAL